MHTHAEDDLVRIDPNVKDIEIENFNCFASRFSLTVWMIYMRMPMLKTKGNRTNDISSRLFPPPIKPGTKKKKKRKKENTIITTDPFTTKSNP